MTSRNLAGIGIQQAVPVVLLEESISRWIKVGQLTREELGGILDQYQHGENRKTKLRQYAARILFGNPEGLELLAALFPSRDVFLPSKGELGALAIGLAAIRYPSIYEVLVLLSTQFRVQQTVNRSFLNHKIGAKYGSNRATEVGLDSVLTMLIGSGLIARVKLGVYQRGVVLSGISQKALEFWVAVDLKLSMTKALLVDDLLHRPWNECCSGIANLTGPWTVLKNETVGGGQTYLTLREPAK